MLLTRLAACTPTRSKATDVNDEANLLEVRDLSVHFRRGHGSPDLRAVDHVDFSVRKRETLGVVGESGSGKTTIGRAVLGQIGRAHV